MLETFLQGYQHIEPLFLDIGIIIILATLIAFVLKLFKQPIIPAYVLTGVLIGPYVFGLISNEHVITTLSELGVAFLLFVVGMEMDFRKLKSIGLIASVGGTVQILILSFVGWFIGLAFGFSPIESLYAGMIVAFSSTMVVIKLLSDKNELYTLHGRIVIGFLLIEDIFAIIALLIIANTSHAADLGMFSILLILLVKLGIILFVMLLMGKVILPRLFKLAAKSQEILFLFSITVCFLFSFLTSLLGLSIAIGAFIGGLSIAHLPYNFEIAGKIKALRVFFTTIFFTALGMKINLAAIDQIIIPLLVFVLFISIGKPLLTSFVCSFFGYKKRTSLLSSITIAQTSEFSIIIVALGLQVGQLDPDSIVPTLAILLSVATMIITSYTIKYDKGIYERIKGTFGFLDKLGSGNRELEMLSSKESHDAILIGYDRIGYNILKTLQGQKKKSVVIDFNPEIVRSLINEGIDCIYGDVSDTEILKRINLKKAELLISTVPEVRDNLLILQYAKETNPKMLLFLTATRVEDALELYANGADYVILAHFLGGHHVSVMLEEETYDLNKLLKRKLEHIKELEHRKNIGHEHTVRTGDDKSL